MTCTRWIFGIWLGVATLAAGRAQAPPASVDGVLTEMASRAGVIFAGEVITVTRMDPAGFVDIRFRVDDPVAGCHKGSYVLREWAGLWNGPPRYGVGQHLLMLLHARGASGMSSPVDGLAGAIPLLGTGAPALLRAGQPGVDSGDSAPAPRVDLRWIGAHRLRTPVRSPGAHAHSVHSTANDSQAEEEWTGPVGPAPTTVAAGYDTVAGLLRGMR